MPRGRKLVVQLLETFREHMEPAFVERLDAWELAERMGMELPPVMIYGDDVTHVVTEEGIANLLLCRDAGGARRRHPRGRGLHAGRPRPARAPRSSACATAASIRRAEDLGHRQAARPTRDLLAARSVKDLVRWSGGLYDPPAPLPQLVKEEAMERLAFELESPGRPAPRAPPVVVGVVASGNLEVLVEPADLPRPLPRRGLHLGERLRRDLGGRAAGLRRPQRGGGARARR